MKRLIFTLCLAASLAPVHAEEIRVPVGQQGQAHANTDRPAAGMSMQQVIEKYGQPQSVRGPVGTPPIERWDYPAFVVVFEGKYVIHSVLKRK
ncbi:MAG: hypothetical protein D6758_13415 [Gammaproteobacteria bacterium]|nr:MAG: hypothetical protein D6758_13415 [Gammaproteobacteria bacterium]